MLSTLNSGAKHSCQSVVDNLCFRRLSSRGTLWYGRITCMHKEQQLSKVGRKLFIFHNTGIYIICCMPSSSGFVHINQATLPYSLLGASSLYHLSLCYLPICNFIYGRLHPWTPPTPIIFIFWRLCSLTPYYRRI